MNNFLAMPDTQVVAVCDVDTTRREHHQKMVEEFYSIKGDKEYKGCAAYKDFRDLLARKDIDAVVIATPDHWHAYIAIAACKAGKDIYCEKPLSLTIHEARAMVKAARKYDRVSRPAPCSGPRSEFLQGLRAGPQRPHRQGQAGHRGCRRPSSACDLPEEPMEPGLDWDLWLGPAPMRPYNSVLSPRGVHTHFPNWRNYREYSGGMMTDWGAHHFDIAQWGLGMDDSGPVEIIPPDDPKATRGVRYLYANGVEMIHGDSGGVLFIGTEGKILVNRGKFEATPAVPGRGAAARQRHSPLQELQPHQGLPGLHAQPQAAHLRRRDRLPLRHGLPPGQPRLLEPPPPQLGPGEGAVHRRQGSQQVAGPAQARPLEGLSGTVN